MFVEAETGGPVTLSFTTADGRHLEPAAVSAVRLAPAARSSPPEELLGALSRSDNA